MKEIKGKRKNEKEEIDNTDNVILSKDYYRILQL